MRARWRRSHARHEREREYYRKLDEERRLREEEQKRKFDKQQEESQSGGCLSSIFWLFIFVCFIIYLFQSCGNLL